MLSGEREREKRKAGLQFGRLKDIDKYNKDFSSEGAEHKKKKGHKLSCKQACLYQLQTC